MTGKYTTEHAAKRGHCSDGNCIVEFGSRGSRSYDWFPPGHPIGKFDSNGSGNFVKATNFTIIARAYKQANGDVVWRS